jgi:hypothetical protein
VGWALVSVRRVVRCSDAEALHADHTCLHEPVRKGHHRLTPELASLFMADSATMQHKVIMHMDN